MATLVIKCGTLVLPKETLSNVFIHAQDGVVTLITSNADAPSGAVFVDAGANKVVPGFVDIHVHGALDHDTMDATPEGLAVMSTFFASHGVTSFLPTTMTAPRGEIDAALLRSN